MQHNKLSFEGKTALVTGAAKRIGARFVRRLHERGASVIIHYRHSDTAAWQLCDELNAHRQDSAQTVRADLSDHQCYETLVKTAAGFWGRLDILVNNASSFYPTPIGQVTHNDWEDLFASNLKAPFFLAQAATEYLRQSKGVIVNLADIHGQKPLANHPVYCSAKAGLIMLTQSLAKELAPDIRVNAIAPGSILWPEGDAALSGDSKERVIEQIALKRLGDPEDLASLLLYLSSDAGSYITGQVIAVDGGRSL